MVKWFERKLFRNDLQRSEWLHQLYTFLNEGYSLLEALKVMELYEPEKRKDWFQNIYQSLVNGEQFSSQLSKGGFSREVVSLLKFAEKYGDLYVALKRSSDILKTRYDLKKKSMRMLSYPIFLFICLMIICIILAEGILPQFEAFFQSMDAELPFMTKIVLKIFSLFQFHIFIFIMICISSSIIWLKKQPVHKRLHIVQKIPIVRTYVKMYCTYYLVSQLSPLLNNHFSLYESLTILQKDTSIPFIREEATYLLEQMKNGEAFSKIIQERKFYEEQLSIVIDFGETKGKLGEDLERYGRFLFQKQSDKIKKLITVAQPAIFAGIGMIVIFLFMSMMMPIFQLMDNW